jgi:parallel beta-helix repeat protein
MPISISMVIKSVFVSLFVAAFVPSTFAQGSLVPPGPPGATMKTLDQIEPRRPISSLPITITNSGSYYFTTNLTGAEGITVKADNVTIDLAGFALVGTANIFNGIYVEGTRANLRVMNGSIVGWEGAAGIRCADASSALLTDLRIELNSHGIYANTNCTIRNCILTRNYTGIFAYEDCLIENCMINSSGGTGVEAYGVTIRNCVANQNGFHGIYALYSQIQNCSASRNAGTGIWTGPDSTVTDCLSANNGGHGIYVTHGCMVMRNQCVNQNATTQAAGIYVAGNNNRIHENALNNNTAGIRLLSTGNAVTLNSSKCLTATSNYVFVAGNIVGPIVTSASTAGMTNAFANFQF